MPIFWLSEGHHAAAGARATSVAAAERVDRDRRLVAVRHGPDDVLRPEGRVAAEEDLRAASTAWSSDRPSACPSGRTRCRCRARSRGRRSPGRSRPARRRIRCARPARRSAASWRRPLSSMRRRDLLEDDAGEAPAVMREFLGHEVVEDRDALVHRVLLLPGRRLHLLEAGADDDLDVLAAEAARGAAAVHRGVAAAEHDDARPILSIWPKETLESQSMPIWMLAAASLRPGMSRSRPRGAPRADEDRVVSPRRGAPSGCRCAGRSASRCRRCRRCSRPPRRSPPRAGGSAGSGCGSCRRRAARRRR